MAHRTLRRILTGITFCVTATTAAAQMITQIISPDPLRQNVFASTRPNTSGQLVFQAQDAGGSLELRYFLWSATGTQAIDLSGLGGLLRGSIYLNNHGAVAGTVQRGDIWSGSSLAYSWDAVNGAHALPSLPTSTRGPSVNGIGDNGVIFGSDQDADGYTVCVYWDAGGIHQFGPAGCYANYSSPSGEYFTGATSSPPTWENHAFRFSLTTGFTTLATADDGGYSQGTAVNDSGIVFGSYGGGYTKALMRWDAAGVHTVELPSFAPDVYITGVNVQRANAAGQLQVHIYDYYGTLQNTYVYDPQTGWYDTGVLYSPDQFSAAGEVVGSDASNAAVVWGVGAGRRLLPLPAGGYATYIGDAGHITGASYDGHGGRFAYMITGVPADTSISGTGHIVPVNVDHTPPVVTVPSDITKATTSTAGIAVTFTATALDDVSGALTPSCDRASGSLFAVGTTAVTCSATDAAGNAGSATFNVTVTLDPALPGDMHGEGGFNASSDVAVDFNFNVKEKPTTGEKGTLRVTITSKVGKKNVKDVFEMTALGSLQFSDDPNFRPGSRKKEADMDTVDIIGSGAWNGQAGYTFSASASDRSEPGKGRDTFTITVRNNMGMPVATVGATITQGNIQSKRLKGRN